MTMNGTTSKIATPLPNSKKTSNTIAIRKLLASSALATAIISWLATAQGLHLYVFEHYWQAAIISAAIQGTLFAFSVHAITLQKKLRLFGKLALLFLWIALLSASSIFSYIYISKYVYSEQLLEEDSNRIIEQNCLELSYQLDNILDAEKKTLESNIETYINLLATTENKVAFSADSIAQIDNILNRLNSFNNYNTISLPNSILTLLTKIKTGQYSSNDMKTLKDLLTNETTIVDKKIKELETRITEETNIYNILNSRLATFRNVNLQEYKNTVQQADNSKQKIDTLTSDKNSYTLYINELATCSILIQSIENSYEKIIYDETLRLRACLNEEQLNSVEIQDIANQIYNTLLDNNISSTDERLTGYRAFRNNVTEYKKTIDSKEIIKAIEENVYNYTSGEITDWGKLLYSIKDISKDIPQEYYEQYNKGKAESFTSNLVLDTVISLERLYLSDLNDFERAWTLLLAPIHKYKTLLIFSVIFAFGMDLFSFGVGVLLYFINDDLVTPNKNLLNRIFHKTKSHSIDSLSKPL